MSALPQQRTSNGNSRPAKPDCRCRANVRLKSETGVADRTFAVTARLQLPALHGVHRSSLRYDETSVREGIRFDEKSLLPRLATSQSGRRLIGGTSRIGAS